MNTTRNNLMTSLYLAMPIPESESVSSTHCFSESPYTIPPSKNEVSWFICSRAPIDYIVTVTCQLKYSRCHFLSPKTLTHDKMRHYLYLSPE